MTAMHKNSDAVNSDMVKPIHEVPPLSEKVKVQQNILRETASTYLFYNMF